jgi:hypothetical protein
MPDEAMSFYVMRLFCGEPIWTPFNRKKEVSPPTTNAFTHVSLVFQSLPSLLVASLNISTTRASIV